MAALAERLTSAHEDSVRRLEDTLLTYTRVQAHDELQVSWREGGAVNVVEIRSVGIYMNT